MTNQRRAIHGQRQRPTHPNVGQDGRLWVIHPQSQILRVQKRGHVEHQTLSERGLQLAGRREQLVFVGRVHPVDFVQTTAQKRQIGRLAIGDKPNGNRLQIRQPTSGCIPLKITGVAPKHQLFAVVPRLEPKRSAAHRALAKIRPQCGYALARNHRAIGHGQKAKRGRTAGRKAEFHNAVVGGR